MSVNGGMREPHPNLDRANREALVRNLRALGINGVIATVFRQTDYGENSVARTFSIGPVDFFGRALKHKEEKAFRMDFEALAKSYMVDAPWGDGDTMLTLNLETAEFSLV